MNILLLAALLLPLHAFAEQCTPNSIEPCTPHDDKKKEILKAINAGILADQTIDGEKLEAKINAARARGDEEAEYVARTRLRELLKERDSRFTDAMRLTALHYRLDPPKIKTVVAPPDDPTGHWAAGIPAKWDPVFLDRDKEYVKVPGNENKPHYLGGKIDRSLEGGGTYGSGKTIILRNMIQAAYDAQNPGPLAYIIHHEAHHFKELTGQAKGREGLGWDSYDEGELRAYTESKNFAPVFELKEDWVKEAIDKKLIEFADAGKPGHKRSLFPTLQEERALETSYAEQEGKRIGLEAAYESLKMRVEAARQARREAEERRQREEGRQGIMKTYKEWAAWHQFEPLMTPDGKFSYGFRRPDRCEYYFTSGGTSLDEALMAMMFASSCIDRGFHPSVKQKLAGIIESVNKRWSDRNYRSKIELEVTDGAEEDCLRNLRDNVRVPLDLEGLNKATERYWKDWERNARRRMDETQREIRRREEEARREQRRRERGGSGGGSNHDVDLTPAQEVLDRYRQGLGGRR